MDANLFELVESGGLVAALCFCVWFLNRRNDALTSKVENRYDAELSDLRRRQEECEEDRKNLHVQIASMLREDD